MNANYEIEEMREEYSRLQKEFNDSKENIKKQRRRNEKIFIYVFLLISASICMALLFGTDLEDMSSYIGMLVINIFISIPLFILCVFIIFGPIVLIWKWWENKSRY